MTNNGSYGYLEKYKNKRCFVIGLNGDFLLPFTFPTPSSARKFIKSLERSIFSHRHIPLSAFPENIRSEVESVQNFLADCFQFHHLRLEIVPLEVRAI